MVGGRTSHARKMIIIGVDTGVEYHAEAWVQDGTLVRAVLIPDNRPITGPADRIVIECATVRRADGHTKKREVDALNRAAGRLGANFVKPAYVLPEEWKGQVPKKIDHQRTLALLSAEEVKVLPQRKSELLHVLDAVGIALWACGRKT